MERVNQITSDKTRTRNVRQTLIHAKKVMKRKMKREKAKLWFKCSNTKTTLPFINVQFSKDISEEVLLDSGSTINLISLELFEKLNKSKLVQHFQKDDINCFTVNNQVIHFLGSCIVKIKIQNLAWYVKFYVGINVFSKVVLGSKFMLETKMMLDMGKKKISFEFNPNVKIELKNTVVNTVSHILHQDQDNSLNIGTPEAVHDIHCLVAKYPKVFTNEIGEALDFEFEIQVKDQEPINIRPYPMSPPKVKIMKEIIDDLLKQNIIRPSLSAYSSPSFLVGKPNSDKFRLVTNYTKLNNKLVRVNHPIGNVQSTFHYLQGAVYFTVLDLNNSFYQIKLKESCKHITAFSTPHSSYEYNRVPYGLHCGSGILSGYLDNLLHDIKYDFVLNFIDDLIIFSKDLPSHMLHLEEVVSRLNKAHLTVNPAKVKFAAKEISFLGHLVSENCVKINPDRTKAIRDYTTPKSVKQVSRFIGMVSFFSKYIPNYAEIASPLNDLRKKKAKFKWTEQCESSFKKLKDCISNPPVLRMIDFEKELILMCDASQSAAGSCLMQIENGVKLPIAYFSKRFSTRELLMSTYEKEALSAILSIEKFHEYLCHKPFLLLVDNHALSWTLSHWRKLGRLGRWVERILSLPFRVEHVAGKDNCIADALSRLFEENKDTNEDSIKSDVVPKVSKKERCVNNKFVNKGSIDKSETINVIVDCPLAFSSILEHQKQDPDITSIVNRINKGETVQHYFISKGILMYKNKEKKKARIVLPSLLIDMIFNYYHTSQFGGHPGFKRTLGKIQSSFYRPDLHKVIKSKVKSCDLCIMSKPAQRIYQGELIANQADRPMRVLYTDLCGPLTRTVNQNNHILIVVDSYTRYTWLIPLRDAKAIHVIKKIEEIIFNNFSACETIVSDNGPAYKSIEFKKFCFKYGIKHHRIVPYVAQANRSERFIKTLNAQLKAYYHDKQQIWDKDLGYLQTSLNTAISDTHQCTPFELMFRYTPNHALSNLWHLNDLVNESLTEEESKDLMRRAIANIKKAVLRNKRRNKYNPENVKHPFVVGSRVFLKTNFLSKKVDKFSKKLALSWSGPYEIIYFVTPVTCLLKLKGSDKNKIIKCHISQLKLG